MQEQVIKTINDLRVLILEERANENQDRCRVEARVPHNLISFCLFNLVKLRQGHQNF